MSIEQIIYIAKTKEGNLLCKDFKSSVKTVVGTCVSLGILIESKPAVEIESEIDEGKYDKEINAVKTETSPEKKKELAEFYSKIMKEQEKLKQQEQAAKAAEESKAAEAAATTPAVAAPKAAVTPAKAPAKK